MASPDNVAAAALIKALNTANEFYIDEGCHIIELTTAEEDPTLSIARCRVEPGKTTRWHRLRGTTERYLIQSGIGVAEVGELPPQVVKAGDIVLIPSGCRQRIQNSGSADLLFLAVCSPRFSPDVYEDIG